MSANHNHVSKKFKAGRLRRGDESVRLMDEEGDGIICKKKCKVVVINKKHIVCEIQMGSAKGKGNKLKLITFDKKTGINIRGESHGWLENPKKKRDLPETIAEAVSLIERIMKVEGDERPPWELYRYCS